MSQQPRKEVSGYVLCLTGMRSVNKRMTLFVEGLRSQQLGVRIGSPPRGIWTLSKAEMPLHSERQSSITLDLGCDQGARLVSVMCFHWLMLPIAVLVGMIRRVPVLYDEHDHYELNTQESGGSALRRFLSHFAVRTIHRFCLPRVSIVTCIHMAQSVLKEHLAKWQPAVLEIHNYPTILWRTTETSSQESSPLCFVYIGGVFAEKGPGAAAEALQLLSPRERERAQLHVFGEGDQALIERLRETPGVVVHNAVTPETFRQFAGRRRCCGLSLLAATKRYRLVGTNCTKLYEYLAMRMPVIATDVGEFPSFVANNEVGLVVSARMSPLELSQAMARMINDDELYARMSANAGSLMNQDEMTWEHEWQKVATCGILRNRAAA